MGHIYEPVIGFNVETNNESAEYHTANHESRNRVVIDSANYGSINIERYRRQNRMRTVQTVRARRTLPWCAVVACGWGGGNK